MKTCLVSLVSDQTIPNILVALHFRPDFLLFFSTKKMEEKVKTKAILDTLLMRGLDYTSNYHVFQVNENSLLDLQQQFIDWTAKTGDAYNYIVNLTCGNKLMSLSAYDLFKEYEATMVYVPIPRNEFLIPFPKHRPKEPTLLKERLSVEEYLTAYGFSINNKSKTIKNFQKAKERRKITEFIINRYEVLQELFYTFIQDLRELIKKFPKNGYAYSLGKTLKNDSEREMLKLFGFGYENGKFIKNLDKSECRFLCGGWLEEYVYIAVEEALGIKGNVMIGVEAIDRKGNKNEFDVIFTYENSLNLIECKSLDPGEGSEFKVGIIDFYYKLGALRRNFGLTPNAYLATTSKEVYDQTGNIKPHLIERGKQFNITLVPYDKLKNIKDFLSKT